MSELYIPPDGIYFRLKNKSSNYVLYSRWENDPTFYHYGGDISDDQWWHLVPGTGDNDTYYLIKGKITGKVIFSRKSPDPKVSHVEGDGKWKDNYFKLEAGSGDRENWFRLRNYDSDTVIFSRTTAEPYLSNVAGNYTHSDDQYWSFHFEDTKFEKLEYQIDQGKILSAEPEDLDSEAVINDTDANQSTDITITQTRTTTHTFERTHGFTAKEGMTGDVDLPFIAKGKLTVKGSTTHTFKWGDVTTETKPYSVKVLVSAPAHTKVTATLTVTHSKVEVPFTLYLKSIVTGYMVENARYLSWSKLLEHHDRAQVGEIVAV